MSLIEALNGPHIPRHPPSAMPDLVETPENEPAVQAAQILNRHSDDCKGKEKDPAGTPEVVIHSHRIVVFYKYFIYFNSVWHVSIDIFKR